jgi:hypothetical protein
MIRICIVSISLLVVSLNISAQDAKKFDKAVSFNFNVGVPVGNFASTDKASNESGYAQVGLGFDLNYVMISATKGSGLLATFRYMSFNYDIDAAVDAHKPSAPGAWYGEGENWKSTSVMLGGFLDLQPGDRFAIEARAQGGIQFTQSKDRYISGIGSGGTYNVKFFYHNESASSFCFKLGIGLRAKMSYKSSFIAGLDFYGATPSISYNSEFTSASVVAGTNTGTFTQPMNSILISAGFLFVIR